MYEPVTGWGTGLPEARGVDLPDVSVSPEGDVCVLYREPSFVVVSDSDGRPKREIGRGIIKRPHGVTAGRERLYVVDEGADSVLVFTMAGDLVGRIGGGPSDPDFPRLGLHVDRIVAPLPPFTRPTRLAIAPWGDLYVSDGYGNCRIHRYTADGELLGSWGAPGSGPGEFRIPHAVSTDRQGRVLVCDRENDRIQVFERDGRHLETWPDIQRPQAVAELPGGGYAVAEGIRPRADGPEGPLPPETSGVAVLDRSGLVLSRTRTHPGQDAPLFLGAHSIAVDTSGDAYVSECAASILRQYPDLGPADRPAIVKLRLVGKSVGTTVEQAVA